MKKKLRTRRIKRPKENLVSTLQKNEAENINSDKDELYQKYFLYLGILNKLKQNIYAEIIEVPK